MILLVDDDLDDLELFQEVLNKSEYDGDSKLARNGQELLDLLHAPVSLKPELIMLDLNMPVKNGFDALREIKSDSSLREIPVAILSASSNDADRTKCQLLGCDLYFKKPYSMNEYRTLVQDVLAFLKTRY